MSEENKQKLGILVAGSLEAGIDVKLDGAVSVEDMAVGRYVTIEGQKQRFFGMITDVSLGVTDERLTQTPPDISDPFLAEVLAGTSTYGSLHIVPYLTIGGAGMAGGPMPVKTVPSHYSVVNLASQEDVELVFGKEDKDRFYIGTPLDMETKICLDLPALVKRSNGIFGKSGTGKTFLTRMLLAGIIKENVAVNLVFDMHNEYGWKSQDEAKTEVKGLRQLFPSGKAAVVTLDPESSRRRGSKVDYDVTIGYDQLEPEDVAMLQSIMGLSDVQVGALYAII